MPLSSRSESSESLKRAEEDNVAAAADDDGMWLLTPSMGSPR